MQIGKLTKITAANAEEVCKLVRAAGHELQAGDSLTPADFAGQLNAASRLGDMVRFFAFGLPKREAVWWACLCVRSEMREAFPAPYLASLEAAEAWVYRPIDENRRAAMAKAQATDFRSPAVWPAVAAFWSAGSMAPPDLPAVPPLPHLTGVGVDGAVTLAAVHTAPELADERRKRYIEMAIDIANGGDGRLERKS